MLMKLRFSIIHFALCTLMISLSQNVYCQPSQAASMDLSLKNAVMCEAVESYLPKNAGMVFSITNGKIVCYTSFDAVPAETVIYHNWYKKDQLITSRKLVLKPPKWSTFTEIQLREADKGPWRVEVVDKAGYKIKVLRFSITE